MERLSRYGDPAVFQLEVLGRHTDAPIHRVPAASHRRLDSPSSFSSRRPSQLTPYKLKCEKEPLSGRIGPPDFHPQTPNCPEETLTREYLQTGYKETVEGIEEAKEIGLSQIGNFPKPVIQKCKEALKKRLKAINDSRAQKRKAGQVYGVPLSGSLLTKPGVFPEQRPYGEESRKKWIEGLSQPHKRLRSLADHVPHGFKRNALLDVLIRHNVPLLRATWFVKVNILNQNKSGSEKTHSNRTDQWTKIVIENLKYLLDDFLSRDGAFPAPSRDQSPQTLLSSLSQNKSDAISLFSDGEEPIAQYKWWYMVRVLQWHFAEGLLSPAPIIEWVFTQLQEKDSLEALELLLPIVINVIDKVALSQTFVCTFLDIAVRAINTVNPSGTTDLPSNARKGQVASVLCELLRYLMLALPDTFVALDAFPLPTCVLPDIRSTGNSSAKILEKTDIVHYGSRDAWHRYLSFGHVISSLHRRTVNLTKVASPNLGGHGVAKVVQALDKALMLGDVKSAYNCLFEELSDITIEEGWFAEVSPCLWSSLKWIGSVSMSTICVVFFLCEWATCDYRDFRTSLPQDVKFTGRKDLSQVHFAVSILKLRIEDMHNAFCHKNGTSMTSNAAKSDLSDFLQSPGPFHDILVCWLDRHEVGKGEGFKCLQVLIMELINSGVFHPHAYVRQLIVSGIMDVDDTALKWNRQKRHYRILKQLPGSYLFDALKEAKHCEVSVLHEIVRVYANERRLLLCGLSNAPSNHLKIGNDSCPGSMLERKAHSLNVKDIGSPSSLEHWKNDCTAFSLVYHKHTKTGHKIAGVKNAILVLLNITGSALNGTKNDELHGKRALGSLGNKVDASEGISGCEECRKVKRQKLNDEKGHAVQGVASNPSDDEDSWWVRKGAKSIENLKVEPTLKSTKHASRGRRKTQSLAQLAAARIESSQGASTSHVCESKLTCPHHKSSLDGEVPRASEGMKAANLRDVGKAMKQLRLLEKRSIIIWLLTLVKQLVEGNEKACSKPSNGNGPFSPPDDERTAVRWKLGEDELSSLLYLLDVSCDLLSAVKFLLWLLPRVLGGPVSSVHLGRNILMLSRNKDNQTMDVGEVFFLSCLQRYENVLVATELLPEALTAAMQRVASGMTSSGRSIASPTFIFVKKVLKRYIDVPSIVSWEKNFRSTCDPRLLTELEAARSLDVDVGYSLGVPNGVEDIDEYIRQKIIGSGRISRTGLGMKELVQRYVEDAVHYFCGKDRKQFTTTNTKISTLEKWDDDYHIAQQIASSLLDCIRQNGGAAQEDLSLVSSAVSAIVGNVGLAIAKLPELAASCNYQNLYLPEGTLSCVQRIVRVHISSLCLLKEAFGERLSRIFEIVLAAEASSIVSGAFSPGKGPRNQFQLSPETHDMSPNISNEALNAKTFVGRAVKAAAAVSALVVGAIVHGISSLERMITVLKLKEGLDVMNFIKNSRSSSNGISRSSNAFKFDSSIEVCVHWFRVLIGSCRTVFDGLVADMLGESYVLAFSRMQHMLPLSLAFPPVYSIFGVVIWRPYILSNVATREEIQLYQCLTLAISDALRHRPFRDICFRDTHVLCDLVASDAGDSEFAPIFELHNQDKHLKTVAAFVPLRGRLFLTALIDCKMPSSTQMRDDGTWVSGHGDQRSFESETKPLDELVHVLDTIQPAKFHWQWIMLRLLLNEQVLIEKIENRNMSLAEAIRSLYPNSENSTPPENEGGFTEILLTRLLVRPDAAALYSEIFHLLGRSLEDKLLLNVRWLLGGNDVLYGRKSIRQRLINFAQPKGLSTKPQFCKPWGWSSSVADTAASKADKRKAEISTLEEGEVVEEGMDIKKLVKLNPCQSFDSGLLNSNQQFTTEKALSELVLPCIDRSSSEARTTFASELVKQMCLVDQHISSLACGAKQGTAIQSGVENSSSKSSNRKGIRGGSPGMGRRPTGTTDAALPSTAALKASLWLRLQFILRSVPIIYTDRDPSVRNLRHTLASVLLHLLGTRIVYEDAEVSFFPIQKVGKRDVELPVEASFATSLDLSGESLFDMFISVFHCLLSGCKPSWLKLNSSSKSTSKAARDFCPVDRDFAENLQVELDRMHLPLFVRKRIQAAMPMLPPSPPLFISCHPPVLSSSTLTAVLQPNSLTSGFQQASSNHSQRSLSSSRLPAGARNKPLPSQDPDMEIDPWILLEDGTGSSSSTAGNGTDIGGVNSDHSNLKACSWLKGAVRVRRTDLIYIGAMDEDN